MSALNGLKFVTATRPTQIAPIQLRRNKLSNAIWQQIQLAKALAEGKTYAPTRYKTVRDLEGNSKSIEVPKRIKRWWWVSEAGKVVFNVRYGTKTIELARGKAACEVATGEELLAALEAIKQAVEQGAYDTQINAVSGALRSNFNKG